MCDSYGLISQPALTQGGFVVSRNSKGQGPETIKLFFMFSSAKHEIFFANEYENANKGWYFHIY